VAGRLSSARQTAAARFASELRRLLADLAMARTQFEVRFNPEPLGPESWSSAGIDRAEFFVSPNPGEEPRALARIASGGELSRIMLALKTLSAHSGRSPGAPQKTLIFDEVHAGIGGQVADVLGRRLHELGDDFQVLCITHLPQIAARATTHFRIAKEVRRGRTLTTVERLTAASRVDEVARMIAGEAASDAVRASAGEMLSTGSRRPSSEEAKGESESPPRGENRSKRSRN
jgi:DNA repair protein RecN (Recombination protein N)